MTSHAAWVCDEMQVYSFQSKHFMPPAPLNPLAPPSSADVVHVVGRNPLRSSSARGKGKSTRNMNLRGVAVPPLGGQGRGQGGSGGSRGSDGNI